MHINFRLVQALQYLYQFNFDIYYKSGKDNIILNILSQLVSTNTRKLLPTHNKLNILFTVNINFIATIVQINNKLQKRILSKYKLDKW